jgi:hypothetical protein
LGAPVTASAACQAVVNQVACVTQVDGPIVSHPNLRTDSPINVGETIRTGPGAFVVVYMLWSDGRRTCTDDTVVDENAVYPVRPEGLCAELVKADSRVQTSRHYTGEKGDDGRTIPAPPTPPAVAAAFRDFDYLQQALKGGMRPLRRGENQSGPDFDNVGVIASSAAHCAALCAVDSRCRAMTFIGPPQNRCWMKSQASPAGPGNDDMVSSTKRFNPATIATPR